ncbi:hypothetical protein [Phenylobacterium sp.]|uniref:hypothetical protein n=1 Tax=Phenylobacterium sp. TaxID=1871053 RepID=UPI002DEA025F|nr:hypothetical protein [Phenylobacterium sp.]
MRHLSALIVVAALAASAADAHAYRPPRTAYGQPDLQGLWTNSAMTMLARPPMIKGLVPTPAEAAAFKTMFLGFLGNILSTAPIDPNKPAPDVAKAVENTEYLEMDLNLARVGGQLRSSWIVEPADGQIPLTDAGKALAKTMSRGNQYDGPEVRPMTERCVTAIGSPEGPPMMNTGFNANYQIVQTRDHVAIEVEMNHDVRIIRLTDRAHGPAAVRRWMGDSVGWWEGDTLVVESTNFHPQGTLIGGVFGVFAYRPDSIVRERFTRTSKDEILYEFTVEDPVIFSKPWRAEMSFRPTKGPIYEYACHEGNYGVANALAGARYQERQAAAEAAKPAPAAKPGAPR